jgi:hypothetical protein
MNGTGYEFLSELNQPTQHSKSVVVDSSETSRAAQNRAHLGQRSAGTRVVRSEVGFSGCYPRLGLQNAPGHMQNSLP